MPKDMTPRQRVEAALRLQPVDKIPFTVYEQFVIPSETERHLRNVNLCIIERNVPVFDVVTPDVRQYARHTRGDGGATIVRKVYETPLGVRTEQFRRVPGTSWNEEWLFKGPEDYGTIEFLIGNQRYLPSYDSFVQAEKERGSDVLLRPSIGYSPLQEIIYSFMGVEQFSIEWGERRDEVMRLYHALTEDRRRMYPVVAQSPVFTVTYCGNVSPEVVGRQRFDDYVLPHYEECAEVLHKHGKLLGVHLDANNQLFGPSVARSHVDYIEAFTPTPTCDMSVAEARRLWPGKALWINFPSSLHVYDPAVIDEATCQILQEAAPGDGFLIGITEDVPPQRWQANFTAIVEAIESHGRYPI